MLLIVCAYVLILCLVFLFKKLILDIFSFMADVVITEDIESMKASERTKQMAPFLPP